MQPIVFVEEQNILLLVEMSGQQQCFCLWSPVSVTGAERRREKAIYIPPVTDAICSATESPDKEEFIIFSNQMYRDYNRDGLGIEYL